ncbi:MAG: tetratricopeptide repeat protein, partial [Myxococcaceae bacterium]|nr:tetratricopeptide repeat protein [Myxococcaceae bacterium]
GVLSRQGKYPEAEALLRRSLAIAETALGVENPSLSPTLANLGVVLAEQARPADGLPLLERARQIAVATYGPSHPEVAQVLLVLAQLQSATNHPDAPATAQEALEMLLRTLGEEHPIVRETRPLLLAIAKGPSAP